MAAKTRARLQKYGVLQMRVLDLYQIKRVYVPDEILRENLRFKIREAKASFGDDLIAGANPLDYGTVCFDRSQ